MRCHEYEEESQSGDLEGDDGQDEKDYHGVDLVVHPLHRANQRPAIITCDDAM
jgi:hypothetical protein